LAKLHEILAVEGDLRSTAATIIEEAKGTFDKRPTHFLQTDTATKHLDTSQEGLDTTEHKKMETTVAEKLKYVGEMVTRYYDAYLQKESTNQKATGTVEIDGKPFLENVPVVVLLGMEQRLKELRDTYANIPTLQPGPTWEPDKSMAVGVYRSKYPEERFVTKKIKTAFQLAPATDKHPAQVQALDEDVPIAKRTVTTWSGMLSVYDKSLLLDRVDALIQAFKRARMRANDTELVQREMGKHIFEFLHGPLLGDHGPLIER
jgi:hypothetical protein